MTKQEAVENHRKLWRWIAEQTREQKRIVDKVEYFRVFNLKRVTNNCYCCEYVKTSVAGAEDMNCELCPIIWSNDVKLYCEDDAEYTEWRTVETWQEAAHWAEVIAELPERE